MLEFKINLVNKREYEENHRYREVIITIPKDLKKLKEDFKYLGLDYDNLTIQDTHIKNVEVYDTENKNIDKKLTKAIQNINCKGINLGYTLPFQDIEKLYKIINEFDSSDRNKLLAIFEGKSESIINIKDAIKYSKNIDCFDLKEVWSEEELARELIYDCEIDIEDVIDYADLELLGKDYSENKGMKRTEQGFLIQESDLKIEEENLEEEEME